MTRQVGNIGLLVMVLTMILACDNKNRATHFDWQQLPKLPDAVGFAGAFAGVSNGHLLVAGGANFPEGTRSWTGGIKQWSDKVFAFDKQTGSWKVVGALPRPIGYGVSLNWKDRLIVLGGDDQQRHYADAYVLRYQADQLLIDSLPALPAPIANACGALVGDVVYVAGGIHSPTATDVFWALDLGKPEAERQWEVLETWPGAPRMLSVAGTLDGAFYLMSGVSLHETDSLPSRNYLTDAYRYVADKGWQKIADLPHAVAAAPSPAYAGSNQLMVFGGDDGSLAEQNNTLKDEHPGFTTDILRYDLTAESWRREGVVGTDIRPDAAADPNASTWAPVTTPLVVWQDAIVLPVGEVRPGVRTNRILMATLAEK